MSSEIPGNVTKNSGEYPHTFWGMSPNIQGNVTKHSGECPQTLRGMLPSILGNVAKHSYIIIIIVVVITTIIINNFFFVGIMQYFKILQIVFTPKKLIKANYKPSKNESLKRYFSAEF